MADSQPQRDEAAPASWLVEHADLLPGPGVTGVARRRRALDVAAGHGRHALWLGVRGYDTLAVDRDAAAVAFVNAEAGRLAVPVRAEVVDLETGDPRLGHAAYDVIVVVHYLHRPLFPRLVAALAPGGVLVYETFTRAQARRGKPTNPAFLLEPGELRRLVAPLEIVRAREGEFDDRDVAAVVARKPIPGGSLPGSGPPA